MFPLTLGQYYTDDQLANIFCFSMLYQWLQHSYDSLVAQEATALEEGIQSELEVSGGFELSKPRSIEQSSSTPTKRPVSASASVGWVSSPKSEVSECSLFLVPLHLLLKGLYSCYAFPLEHLVCFYPCSIHQNFIRE